MQTLKATFRITTPMFLSGAEQKQAELRVPSVKGALRFWWRALAFGRYGNDVKLLRKAEAALFGGTGTSEGQSKILLRLSQVSVKPEIQQRWNPGRWEAYVGYGLIETTGDQRRQYLEPGGHFELELVTKIKGPQGEGISDLEKGQLQTALRGLGLLGGLGGRSRKGWGSIQLELLKGFANEWSAPKTVKKLQEELTLLLSNQPSDLPGYTALHTQSRFALGPVHVNAVAAHQYLAQSYREIIREIASKHEREQFGLPRKNTGNNADMRKSGPLFLHIHELPNGEAVPLVAFLPARFLPQQRDPRGGWRHVEAFLNKVRGTEGNMQ